MLPQKVPALVLASLPAHSPPRQERLIMALKNGLQDLGRHLPRLRRGQRAWETVTFSSRISGPVPGSVDFREAQGP